MINDRQHLEDDDWGQVESIIRLEPAFDAELLAGFEAFSHVEVLFVFHQQGDISHLPARRHPRNNPNWPASGRLAQRSTHHPNPIGLTRAEILSLDGAALRVRGLDAIHGSPVLDLKPLYREFMPQEVRQPDWVSQLMQNYWKSV